MTDLPAPSDFNGGTGVGSDGEATISTPRWVKVFGFSALVLVLLLVIMLLTGAGGHGPGRHTSSGVTEYRMHQL